MFSKWSPVSVVFEGVKDILGVRMDKVCPRLPQWMHNVVDEPNLSKSMKKKDDQQRILYLRLFNGSVVSVAHGADV